MNFFPYLATGRRPVARLFCTILCTCTKSTKQGLANDGKIGFCVLLARKSCLRFSDARATNVTCFVPRNAWQPISSFAKLFLAIQSKQLKAILCAASPVLSLSLITLIRSINLGANLEHTFKVLTYG